MSYPVQLVHQLAEIMRPALFRSGLPDDMVGPGTRAARDDARRNAMAVLDSGLVVPKPERPFDCPAMMHHGPGSQSRTRCERKSPHDIDGEHYARNPMEPGFEWTGQDGYPR